MNIEAPSTYFLNCASICTLSGLVQGSQLRSAVICRSHYPLQGQRCLFICNRRSNVGSSVEFLVYTCNLHFAMGLCQLEGTYLPTRCR